MNTLCAVATALLLLPLADSHGSLVRPAPRNARDGALPAFVGGRSPLVSCNCGDPEAGCNEGLRAPGGGQPCLWFSQGCFIGCQTCTGSDREGDGVARANNSNDCVGPRGGPSRQPAGSSSMPLLPKRLWTMNREAQEDSPADVYRFHPWRAPGSAPVTDCCGTAGGTSPKYRGPGEAVFAGVVLNGTNVTMGALGSHVLPRGPAAARWRRGATAQVSWGLRFNHGGGYQYRLCSTTEELSE
jgi:hypothetical protein